MKGFPLNIREFRSFTFSQKFTAVLYYVAILAYLWAIISNLIEERNLKNFLLQLVFLVIVSFIAGKFFNFMCFRNFKKK
jgi:hypothetical protein